MLHDVRRKLGVMCWWFAAQISFRGGMYTSSQRLIWGAIERVACDGDVCQWKASTPIIFLAYATGHKCTGTPK